MLGRVGLGFLCSRRGLAGKDLGHGESLRAKAWGFRVFFEVNSRESENRGPEDCSAL